MRKLLSIGVNKYRCGDINNLKRAVSDAAAFQAFLGAELPERFRFDATFLASPTVYEVGEALDNLAAELQAAEETNAAGERNVAVVYFAGHGLSRRDGTRLLLCEDAASGVLTGDDTSGGIVPEKLRAFGRKLPNTDVVFIYDVCRTSVGGRGGAGTSLGEFRDASAWVPESSKRAKEPPKRLTISSCEDDERAADDGSFARAAIEAMRESFKLGRGIELGAAFAARTKELLDRERGGAFVQTPVAEGRSTRLVPAGNASGKPKPTGPVLKVPKPSADDADEEPVEVREYEVGAIDVGVETIEIDEPTEPAQTGPKETYLPPIPTEITDLKARFKRLPIQIASLDKTISALKNETHPSLDAAKGKIAAARRQYDELRNRVGIDAPGFWNALEANPAASPLDLTDFKPSEDSMAAFTRKVALAPKVFQARGTLERAKTEYRANLDAKIAELDAEKKRLEAERDATPAELASATDRFFEVVVLKILESAPGFGEVEAPVPLDAFEGLAVLGEYGLGWDKDEEAEIWRRAAEIWKNRRPCVVERRERLEREAKERERLVAEAKEEERRAYESMKRTTRARRFSLDRRKAILSALGLVAGWAGLRALIGSRPEIAPGIVFEEGDWGNDATRAAGTRKTVTANGIEYAFRWAPPGEFEMGSPESEEGHCGDETQHTVKLPRGFWIGETEVTQELWEAVTGDNPSRFEGTNLPVERVSWEDSQKFIEKLNGLGVVPNDLKFRLPTEAEWEYACRAGTKTAYWWGKALNGDKANCNGNYPCGTTTEGKYLEKTTPVKSYDANAWGLYDTHGNVWEWCSDWYGDYPSGVVEAPTGPTSASDRVIRGGSWDGNARLCRSADRGFGLPSGRGSNVGLRLVLSSSK